MRIKELFVIPEGKKVTEKLFGRVLISSICSILLCMVCLVSTTWAWFTVSVENTGNVIHIGIPEINVTVDGIGLESGKELQPGEYKIFIEHANAPDDFQKKSTLYVIFSADDETVGYIVLPEQNGAVVYAASNQDQKYTMELTIIAQKACKFSWEVSWIQPNNAEALTDHTITVSPSRD